MKSTDRPEYPDLHRDWSIAKRHYRPYHKGFETIVERHRNETSITDDKPREDEGSKFVKSIQRKLKEVRIECFQEQADRIDSF